MHASGPSNTGVGAGIPSNAPDARRWRRKKEVHHITSHHMSDSVQLGALTSTSKSEAAVGAPCACKCACYPPSLRHRVTHSPPYDADGEQYVAAGGYTHARDLLCRAYYLPSPALTPRSTLKHSRAYTLFSQPPPKGASRRRGRCARRWTRAYHHPRVPCPYHSPPRAVDASSRHGPLARP